MKLSQMLLLFLVLIGECGIRASQEVESTQEFIKRLPEGWRTAEGLLYVVNNHSNNITGFLIGDDGSLTPIQGSPFATGGDSPGHMRLSGDGRYLYVANEDSSDITVFSIGDNGSLTEIQDLPFATGGRYPQYIVSAPLPKRWQILQAAPTAAGLRMSEGSTSTLPTALESVILQMLYGENTLGSEEFKEERTKILLKAELSELAENLYRHQYDKDHIIGGPPQRFLSLFMQVKRGILTPEGFQLLGAWAQGKKSKELEEAVEIMQELLRMPSMPSDKARAFESIKERLVALYQAQLAREKQQLIREAEMIEGLE